MDDQVAPLPLQVWRLLVSISTTEATRHVAHGKVAQKQCWKYALEPTGFDALVDSDGFDPLWC
jgi:hypothetical protein